MKYFYDTEFIDRGYPHDIILVSIGMVAEDGRQFYIENSEADLDLGDDFFQKEVRPHLKGSAVPYAEIAPALTDFVGRDYPEFWAWFAAWDWVLVTRTFGTLLSVPRRWPHYTMDLKQFSVELGSPRIPPDKWEGLVQHNALDDSVWASRAYQHLRDHQLKQEQARFVPVQRYQDLLTAYELLANSD